MDPPLMNWCVFTSSSRSDRITGAGRPPQATSSALLPQSSGCIKDDLKNQASWVECVNTSRAPHCRSRLTKLIMLFGEILQLTRRCFFGQVLTRESWGPVRVGEEWNDLIEPA